MNGTLTWTWKEWKQHKKAAEVEAEAVYEAWPKMSGADQQRVLDSYKQPWQYEYFGNVEQQCHIRDNHGRYFRGYCEWQTIEELRDGDWEGLTTFKDAAGALHWIKSNKAAGHPQFEEPYESYTVVPLILEQY